MNRTEAIRVAIVEDHAILREELSHFMRTRGMVVHELSSGAPLGPLLEKEELDLVVLDVNLPGDDGFVLAARIKQQAPHLGVLMLTARSSPGDKITGYDAGADIYLSKPVQPDELLAALRSLLRRMPHVSLAPAWQLDVRAARLVSPQGSGPAVALTSAEVLLLKALLQAPGQQVSSGALCSALSAPSGDSEPSRRALENLVSRLRKKVCEATLQPDLTVIRSVRGIGYQLSLPMQLLRYAPGGETRGGNPA